MLYQLTYAIRGVLKVDIGETLSLKWVMPHYNNSLILLPTMNRYPQNLVYIDLAFSMMSSYYRLTTKTNGVVVPGHVGMQLRTVVLDNDWK